MPLRQFHRLASKWNPLLEVTRKHGLKPPDYVPGYMTIYEKRGHPMDAGEITELGSLLATPGPKERPKRITNSFHAADYVEALTAQPRGERRAIVMKLIGQGRLTPEQLRDFSTDWLHKPKQLHPSFLEAVNKGGIVDARSLYETFAAAHGIEPPKRKMDPVFAKGGLQ